LNRNAWNDFTRARESFRQTTEELALSLPELKKIQQKFADSRGEGKNSAPQNGASARGAYIVETPVVFNSALDSITIDDEIKLILVADNPGRREQAAENRRYLAGPSGKIADKFFRDNSALGIDFRKNVIILNKTPIHSPRTVELRELCRMYKGSRLSLSEALEESQKKMAALLLEFQTALDCPVWIVGYSEMKKGGLFETYTGSLNNLYSGNERLLKQIFFYRHFSMNQFTIDLKQQSLPGETAAKTLKRIGSAYRKRILG
jgi:hypothetical protein